MSAQPTVVAVCLTADRPDMTRQAVDSWRRQTYKNKKLLILDSSLNSTPGLPYGCPDATTVWMPDMNGKKVGELRNAANFCAADWGEADIIITADSDDISHPLRYAEQVALLQSSECVGYNECLFWREPVKCSACEDRPGEAWLYTNRSATWALGTSLCYWRKAWERAPFAALNSGEDTEWFNRVKVRAISSLHNQPPESPLKNPRMVARIHAGNAGNPAYWPAEMAKAPHHWRRVPEWDGYCREVFSR
jgi:hypothetical protein